MSSAAWLDIGRRVFAREFRAAAEVPAASLALDEVVTRRGLGVVAWAIRDSIETTTQVLTHRDESGTVGRHREPPWDDLERRQLAVARGAVELAAVAHLTHRWLRRADYLTLISPFVTLVEADRA